jgi:signal transduction histidine kinase
VELLAEIEPLPHRPDNSIEQACFRIAQESLTNAAARARQPGAAAAARHRQRGLHLQIRDDGEGFDPDGPRGLGLIVMRERAQSVGGHVRIESAHGEGTLIDVHLPTRRPAWPPSSHRNTEPMESQPAPVSIDDAPDRLGAGNPSCRRWSPRRPPAAPR